MHAKILDTIIDKSLTCGFVEEQNRTKRLQATLANQIVHSLIFCPNIKNCATLVAAPKCRSWQQPSQAQVQ